MAYHQFSKSEVVAKKPHRCIWCGELIVAGGKYRREKSIYEGNWQDHCWHIECDDDAIECFRQGDEEFMPYVNERPIKQEPRK